MDTSVTLIVSSVGAPKSMVRSDGDLNVTLTLSEPLTKTCATVSELFAFSGVTDVLTKPVPLT